jgi:hypothetical protein
MAGCSQPRCRRTRAHYACMPKPFVDALSIH